MNRNISAAAFNWLVAVAIVTASITNIAIHSESIGLYLVAYPVIILMMAFLPDPLSILRGLKWFDGFAIVFVILTVIAAVLHPNSKTITYIALYCFALIFMAILLRNTLSIFGWRDFIHRANAAACGTVSLLATAEFLSRYLFGANPIGWLPFINPPLAICGFDIPRSYAMAVEPTYLAWYLSTLGTVAIWYVWNVQTARAIKLLYAFFVIFALVVTWSTSAMVAVPVAAAAILLYVTLFDRTKLAAWRWEAPSFFINGAIVFVAIGAVLAVITSSGSLAPCLNYVGMKPLSQAIYGYQDIAEHIRHQRELLKSSLKTAATAGDTTEVARIRAALKATNNSLAQLKDDPENALSRFQIWKRDLGKAIERPWFGWGPGYNSSSGSSSSLNLFIAVLLENGALALAALVLFLLFVGLHIARSKAPARYVFLLAYLSGCLHMLTQTRFFFPYIWILMALFWVEESNRLHRRDGHASVGHVTD